MEQILEMLDPSTIHIDPVPGTGASLYLATVYDKAKSPPPPGVLVSLPPRQLLKGPHPLSISLFVSLLEPSLPGHKWRAQRVHHILILFGYLDSQSPPSPISF